MLKEILSALTGKSRHSKAGKKFLEEEKKKPKYKRSNRQDEIKDTHLSRQSKQQLAGLSEDDYKAVMGLLNEDKKKAKYKRGSKSGG